MSFSKFFVQSVLAFAGSFLFLFSSYTLAVSDWSHTTTLQATQGDYSDSLWRNNIWSAGIMHAVDYKEKAGLTVGWEYSHVDFDSDYFNNIYGSNWYGSGKMSFFPESVPGKVTARLDHYFNDNQDASDFSDEVRVWNPIISFLNHDKTFYLDFGYANSDYKKDLSLNQYTPTVGFALNQGFDWVQIRGYYINPDKASRVQDTGTTKAVEFKWTHWLGPYGPNNPLALYNIQASFLWGMRVHAVDPDAAAVYSLGDIQRKNAVTIGGEWKLPYDMSVMVLGGRSHWRRRTSNDNYVNRVLYVNLVKKW